MTLWTATLKPICCKRTKGDIHRIEVKAIDKYAAVVQARIAAKVDGCPHYAITDINEVKQ